MPCSQQGRHGAGATCPACPQQPCVYARGCQHAGTETGGRLAPHSRQPGSQKPLYPACHSSRVPQQPSPCNSAHGDLRYPQGDFVPVCPIRQLPRSAVIKCTYTYTNTYIRIHTYIYIDTYICSARRRSSSAPHASRWDDVTALRHCIAPHCTAPRTRAASRRRPRPPPGGESRVPPSPAPPPFKWRWRTFPIMLSRPRRHAVHSSLPPEAEDGRTAPPRGPRRRCPSAARTCGPAAAEPAPALPCRPSAGRGKRSLRSMVVTALEDAAAPGKQRRVHPGAPPPLGARPLPPRPGGRDPSTAPTEPSRGLRDGTRDLGRTKGRPGAACSERPEGSAGGAGGGAAPGGFTWSVAANKAPPSGGKCAASGPGARVGGSCVEWPTSARLLRLRAERRDPFGERGVRLAALRERWAASAGCTELRADSPSPPW